MPQVGTMSTDIKTDTIQILSSINVPIGTAPASASDVGQKGEIRFTSTHIYVCVANNTWKRVAIATW